MSFWPPGGGPPPPWQIPPSFNPYYNHYPYNYPPQPVPHPARSQMYATADLQTMRPAKKHKKSVDALKCDLCGVSVQSDQIMQTHLAGKAHKRRLANAQTLQSFQSSSSAEAKSFSSSSHSSSSRNGGNDEKATERSDAEKAALDKEDFAAGQDASVMMMKNTSPRDEQQQPSSSLKCDVCNVFVNSVQQLEVHNAGAKHKKAAAKVNNEFKVTSDSSNLTFHSLAVELPNSIIRVEDPNKKVAGSYKCKSCDCLLNSEVQMQQHLSSQRHLHLEAGIPYVSRKDARKFAPYPRNKTSFAQDKGPDSDASWKEAAEKLQSEISFTPASSSTTTSQEKQPQQQTVRISRPSLRDSFVKGPVMK